MHTAVVKVLVELYVNVRKLADTVTQIKFWLEPMRELVEQRKAPRRLYAGLSLLLPPQQQG